MCTPSSQKLQLPRATIPLRLHVRSLNSRPKNTRISTSFRTFTFSLVNSSFHPSFQFLFKTWQCGKVLTYYLSWQATLHFRSDENLTPRYCTAFSYYNILCTSFRHAVSLHHTRSAFYQNEMSFRYTLVRVLPENFGTSKLRLSVSFVMEAGQHPAQYNQVSSAPWWTIRSLNVFQIIYPQHLRPRTFARPIAPVRVASCPFLPTHLRMQYYFAVYILQPCDRTASFLSGYILDKKWHEQ